MNANEYQQAAARTLISEPDSEYTGNQIMLVWTALGLAGEAGEVCDDIKKSVFHQHGLNRDKLVKELGDVSWYLAALATLIGVPLSEVFDRNIAKLKARYPDGYNSADSKARVDTNGHTEGGVKSYILSALQYHGPMTVRELEVKLNKPSNVLTPYLTSLYRAGKVERKHVQIDDTRHRYYRYTAYGASNELVTRGAAPPSRG